MFQIRHEAKMPFMKYRKPMYLFSGAVLLATVAWLVVNGGPNYSVDFTGGFARTRDAVFKGLALLISKLLPGYLDQFETHPPVPREYKLR